MDQRICEWACLSFAPSAPNLLHDKQQNPNLEGIIIFFPTGSYSMACDFKVLILIQALTHSAKIHPLTCWRKHLIIRYVLKYKYNVWQSTNLSSVYSKRIFFIISVYLFFCLWEKGITPFKSLLITVVIKYFNIIQPRQFIAWYFGKDRKWHWCVFLSPQKGEVTFLSSCQAVPFSWHSMEWSWIYPIPCWQGMSV